MVLSVLLVLMVPAAIELLARTWIRRRGEYHVFPPGLRLRLQIDREIFPQLEPIVRFEINGIGERGDNPPRSSDGVYRVLYTGGSQPEGYMVDQHSTCPGALQRILERPDTRLALGAARVHVGSICRSGVTAEGLDLILSRLLPRYPRLDLIVVHVGGSDVLRWLEQGAPRDIPHPTVGEVFMCHPEGRFGWTPATCAAWEVSRRARKRWLRPIERHERAGRWYRDVRAMRARATTILADMPDPGPMLERFALHLERSLRRATTHADRVIVVRQSWFDKEYSPDEAALMWHGGAGEAWRENVTTYYAFDVVSRLMALLDERAASIAEALGIEHVDLNAVLERSVATYYDWAHLTPPASTIAAQAIASTIVRPTSESARPSSRPCVDLLAS
jgi:hypothetical protein